MLVGALGVLVGAVLGFTTLPGVLVPGLVVSGAGVVVVPLAGEGLGVTA